MEEYKKMWKNYAVFSGRSTRRDYWMACLFNFVISLAIGIIALALGLESLLLLYAIAVIIPGLALNFRRLHDTNRSAWWLLISLVPIIGVIIVLVLYCLPTVEEGNRFGEIVE